MKHAMLAVLMIIGVERAEAQTPDDFPIDVARRESLLQQVAARYDSLYFSAEKGRVIRAKLTSKAGRARYADCLAARCLADRLTADLQTWSGDKHLRMMFSVKARPMPKQSVDPAAKENEAEAMRRRNFGFHNVERLHGNIGVLEIGRFDAAADAAPTAAAAMSFLANTDALIIDLRGNGGGHADMVAHLMSYFLSEQVQLGTIRRRDPASNTQIWSAAAVSGPRYIGKPVYVLISKRTFSAAEGFAYDLRNHANARIIGETSRGGANPGLIEQLDEHFAVMIPTGQMINEKTKSNWEGVGITPDVSVAAAEAMKLAHKLALEDLVKLHAQNKRADMWRQALGELR